MPGCGRHNDNTSISVATSYDRGQMKAGEYALPVHLGVAEEEGSARAVIEGSDGRVAQAV